VIYYIGCECCLQGANQTRDDTGLCAYPAEMAEPEINACLNYLAVKEMVSVNATA
jgi:hypothetical protein